jgi:uncharacterized membrane protein HdeD (DUF308 family)
MAELRLVVTALALMLAMFLAGVHGLRHRIGVAILALLSVVWFTVDKLFEGEVLFQINRHQGFTSADVVGLLGLIVAVLLWRNGRTVRTPAERAPQGRPAPTREHSSSARSPESAAPW